MRIFPFLSIIHIDSVPRLQQCMFERSASPVYLTKIILTNVSHIGHFLPSDIANNFASVTVLECMNIGGIDENLSQYILCFPKLKKLRLDNCLQIDDACLRLISASLLHLNELLITKCLQICKGDVVPKDSALKRLSITMCPILRSLFVPSSIISLCLSRSGIDEAVLQNVALCCTGLLRLDVSHCCNVSNLALSFRSLSSANFSGCQMLASVELLCPLLVEVNFQFCWSLTQCTIVSDTIRRLDLKMLNNLTSIDLKCSALSTLNLSGCNKLKYVGKFRGDYKPITISLLLENCPSINLDDGSGFAGLNLYDDYISTNSL